MIRNLHRGLPNIALAFLLGLAAVNKAGAAFSSSGVGTTTANFLKLGVGARCEAMGEACAALTNDASALYWNPAALTLIPEKEGSLMLMHAPYLEPTYFDFAGYAQNTGSAGAFGLGMQYFSGGAITQTDTSGTSMGNFNPYDLAVSLGYANSFYGFSFGVTGKYVESKLQTSANAMAVDMGLLTPAYFHDRLRFAVVETNLGGRMTFDQQSYGLPFNLKAGSALSLTPAWKATFDMNFPTDNNPYATIGSEYVWKIRSGWTMAGRVGYNGRSSGDIDGLSGPTAGFGLSMQSYSFDYAMVPMGALGLTHRISFSMRFFTGASNNALSKHAEAMSHDEQRANNDVLLSDLIANP